MMRKRISKREVWKARKSHKAHYRRFLSHLIFDGFPEFTGSLKNTFLLPTPASGL